MTKTQIPRVKLTLNKYTTTWEGKVLRYLHDRHPSKKTASSMVMELALAAHLPYVMQEEGASDFECEEAAFYSVQFLLSQACAIRNKFNLPNIEMQGFIGDKVSNSYVAVSSKATTEAVTIEQARVGEEEYEYEEEDDDEMLELPNIDAGFRT